MRSLCRAILALNVLYCALAAIQPGLPGWHMFESVEPTDHALLDRDGRPIDIRAWLPRGAKVVDRGELREIVAFVCQKERARGPFTYQEPSRGLKVTLDPGGAAAAPGAAAGGCRVHAPR